MTQSRMSVNRTKQTPCEIVLDSVTSPPALILDSHVFQADPIAKPPRPLDVYYALCENIDWEYKTNKHLRDRETDINSYLRRRHHELIEPELYVALFDTERNTAAKKGWTEKVMCKK